MSWRQDRHCGDHHVTRENGCPVQSQQVSLLTCKVRPTKANVIDNSPAQPKWIANCSKHRASLNQSSQTALMSDCEYCSHIRSWLGRCFDTEVTLCQCSGIACLAVALFFTSRCHRSAQPKPWKLRPIMLCHSSQTLTRNFQLNLECRTSESQMLRQPQGRWPNIGS